MSSEVILHHCDFFAHRVAISQHTARPHCHAFAFRRQSLEALPPSAEEDGNTEFEFELFYSTGQARLRDVATLRGAAEVAFFGHRDEIAKLPDEHATDSQESIMLNGPIILALK